MKVISITAGGKVWEEEDSPSPLFLFAPEVSLYFTGNIFILHAFCYPAPGHVLATLPHFIMNTNRVCSNERRCRLLQVGREGEGGRRMCHKDEEGRGIVSLILRDK